MKVVKVVKSGQKWSEYFKVVIIHGLGLHPDSLHALRRWPIPVAHPSRPGGFDFVVASSRSVPYLSCAELPFIFFRREGNQGISFRGPSAEAFPRPAVAVESVSQPPARIQPFMLLRLVSSPESCILNCHQPPNKRLRLPPTASRETPE